MPEIHDIVVAGDVEEGDFPATVGNDIGPFATVLVRGVAVVRIARIYEEIKVRETPENAPHHGPYDFYGRLHIRLVPSEMRICDDEPGQHALGVVFIHARSIRE